MATAAKKTATAKKKRSVLDDQFRNPPPISNADGTGDWRIGDTPVEKFPGVTVTNHNEPAETPVALVRPIALANLKAWDGNVRKTGRAENLEELAANIKAHGVLTSLVVMKTDDGYVVAAGSRRLAALQLLRDRGDIPEDFPVPCRVLDQAQEAQAAEISLAENVVRQGLNPADEFEAFQSLAENGNSVADIAARFGVGESTVKKRLKLANVAPKIVQDFRDGKVTLNQLQAFAITDDHQAQLDLAAKGYEKLETEEIFKVLEKGNVPATDKRVKFLGLETLEQQGVATVRDMFEPERAYVTDKRALQKAVDEKLQKHADDLKAEGWSFVEFVKGGVSGYRLPSEFTEVTPKKIPLSTADQKTLKDLQAQLKALEKTDWDERDFEKEGALEEQIDTVKERGLFWSADVKAKSGAVFSLDNDGKIEIRRGVKKAKPKKADEAEAEDDDEDSMTAPPKPREKSEAEKRNLTDDVMEELTAHRNFAVGSLIASNTALGFKAFAGMAIAAFFGNFDHRIPWPEIELQPIDPPSSMEGKGEPQGFTRLETLRKDYKGKLPKGHSQTAIFLWALEQDEKTLQKYLALIAGSIFIDIDNGGKAQPETEALLKILEIDFTNWYAPTAKNLFNKLGQEQLRELIKEIRGGILTPAEMKLGKEALADLAERECRAAEKAGREWMPWPLGSGKKAAAKPKAKPAKKSGKAKK